LFPEDKEKYVLDLIRKYDPFFIIVIGDSKWDELMMRHAHLKISVGNEKLSAHHVIYSYYELADRLKSYGHEGLIYLQLNGNLKVKRYQNFYFY